MNLRAQPLQAIKTQSAASTRQGALRAGLAAHTGLTDLNVRNTTMFECAEDCDELCACGGRNALCGELISAKRFRGCDVHVPLSASVSLSLHENEARKRLITNALKYNDDEPAKQPAALADVAVAKWLCDYYFLSVLGPSLGVARGASVKDQIDKLKATGDDSSV